MKPNHRGEATEYSASAVSLDKHYVMKRPAEYDAYIRSARWKNICALKKKEVGNKYERCGHSSARLEVHHLTYERFKRENLNDLRVLCKECHEIEDENRKKTQEQKAQNRLYDARFKGYMSTKYGERYLETMEPTEQDYAEFDVWLKKKEEQAMYE